jgi:hypothetical protein
MAIIPKDSKTKKKTIKIFKNGLDLVPFGSVIIFTDSRDLDRYQHYYLKLFRNFLKKHKEDLVEFDENTCNYKLILKKKASPEEIIHLGQKYKPEYPIVFLLPSVNKKEFLMSVIAALQTKFFY